MGFKMMIPVNCSNMNVEVQSLDLLESLSVLLLNWHWKYMKLKNRLLWILIQPRFKYPRKIVKPASNTIKKSMIISNC